MNKKIVGGMVIVVLLVGSLLAFIPKRIGTGATGNVIAKTNGDIFTGKISNVAVKPGTIKGIGLYDRSCKMMSNGLTACDAGIQTEEYGSLNFKYQHNMQQQPCLAPNDIVMVQILDERGNAKVQRT